MGVQTHLHAFFAAIEVVSTSSRGNVAKYLKLQDNKGLILTEGAQVLKCKNDVSFIIESTADLISW